LRIAHRGANLPAPIGEACMRAFAGLIIFAAASGAAHAQELPTAVAPYATRCVEEAGTGFNWKDGRWILTNFNKETLTITKFNEALHKDDVNLCDFDKPPSEDFALDDFGSLNACYSISTGNADRMFDWCEEYYDKTNGVWVLNSAHCSGGITPEISFKPDGAFVFAMTSALLSDKPKDDYKDSLKLSHGRCATVK
jgi:hypothetical protein